MKIRYLFIILTLFFSHVTVAKSQTCPLADNTFTIAWIPKALDNPVFELGRVGTETRATELSATSPCRVEIFVAAPLHADATEQVELVYELIDLKTIDAIGISCVDAVACIAPINAAIAAGIPTMTWDSDSPDSDRITYLGVDNYEGGQIASELLVRFMGERGKVAVLSGVMGSFNLDARVNGFVDAIALYPNIEVVEVVYSNDSTITAVTLVEEVMRQHPDLTGWFFAGLWAFLPGQGAMPLWENATLNGDVVNVGFDTLPLQLSLMSDGYLQGLVGQKYWGWGYDTVQMLYEHVFDGVVFDEFTNSGMDIITMNNVGAMITAWENNNFSEALPPPFED
ncbi:MAG: substrate-binding domain-containing protein [bacterium]|nr:substrate-binding domain-containing protein [bacterium]